MHLKLKAERNAATSIMKFFLSNCQQNRIWSLGWHQKYLTPLSVLWQLMTVYWQNTMICIINVSLMHHHIHHRHQTNHQSTFLKKKLCRKKHNMILEVKLFDKVENKNTPALKFDIRYSNVKIFWINVTHCIFVMDGWLVQVM